MGAVEIFVILGIVVILFIFVKIKHWMNTSDLKQEQSDGESPANTNLPKGVYVYTCESLQSYLNIKQFIAWVAKFPRRDARAIVLIVKNHLNQGTQEWNAFVAAIEKSKKLDLIFIAVPLEDSTSELISRCFPERTADGVPICESLEEAKIQLELELHMSQR